MFEKKGEEFLFLEQSAETKNNGWMSYIIS